jgi:hypothetical protein
MEKVCGLSDKTPFWDDVEAMYDGNSERIQEQNYMADLTLRKVMKKIPQGLIKPWDYLTF